MKYISNIKSSIITIMNIMLTKKLNIFETYWNLNILKIVFRTFNDNSELKLQWLKHFQIKGIIKSNKYFNIWYLIFDIWYLIFDIWYLIFDIWYLIFDIWYLILNLIDMFYCSVELFIIFHFLIKNWN
jgi:hypothetical protein